MVGQHDAAGAHTDRVRSAGDMCNNDGGCRTGDPDHVVMLGKPEPTIPPLLRVPRQIQRMTQRDARSGAFSDECKIENGERNHLRILTADGSTIPIYRKYRTAFGSGSSRQSAL